MAVRYVESEDPTNDIKAFAQVAHKKQSKTGIVVMPRVTEKEKKRLQELFQSPIKVLVFSYSDIRKKTFNLFRLI